MIIFYSSNIDIIQGVIDYGNAEGITDWRISNTNAGIFNIHNSISQNSRVTILVNGNVGIGSTNPSSILDVSGDINITGNYKNNNRDIIPDTSNYVLSTSNILVPFSTSIGGFGSNYTDLVGRYTSNYTDLVGRYTSNYTDLVGRYTSNYADKVGAFGSNYTDLVGRNASNYISRLSSVGSSQWITGGSSKIYYTSNVGIGTTDPTNNLHIFDNINEPKIIIQNGIIPASMPMPPALYTTNPTGVTSGTIGTTDRFYIFTHTGGFDTNTAYNNVPIPAGIECDIFMIGGGGGGGNNCGGGGGAGACIVAIGQTINAGNYTISVGAGGAGGIVNSANGTNGGDSSIGSFYIAKGGGFGAGVNLIGGTGGCGGGGAASGVAAANSSTSSLNVVNSITNISPSTTSTYSVLGKIGGSTQAFTEPNYHQLNGGGGGGIGVNGTNGTISVCGPGGNGVYQVVINLNTYNLRSHFTNNTTFGVQDGSTGNYYIGGGGGGGGFNSSGTITISGGLGGGGNGFDSSTTLDGTIGTTNTGSGGGGGNGNYGKGGNGGSGVVIIRYRVPNTSFTNSSIEFIRRTTTDVHTDFKIGNYNGDFKIISSISGTDVDYFKITTAGGPSIYNPTGSPTWATTSDKRIKENIEKASYDKCFKNIDKLDLYRFNYIKEFNNINKDIRQLGFIAQDVNEIFPKAVSTYNFTNDNLSIPDLLSIDITQINYSLYGAVKKLIERYEDKDNRIKRLELLLNINDATSSNVAVDATSSNVAVDATSSNVAVDATSSNVAIDTTSSNIAIDATSSNVAE